MGLSSSSVNWSDNSIAQRVVVSSANPHLNPRLERRPLRTKRSVTKRSVTLAVSAASHPSSEDLCPSGSHRGGQAALRVRAGFLEEMWGKVSLAEGTAYTKTLRHKVASAGVSGAHGPHWGLGLVPLMWGCGP